MLANATLLTIQPLLPADVAGRQVRGSVAEANPYGPAVAGPGTEGGVRGFMADVTRQQRWGLGGRISTATAVLTVAAELLPIPAGAAAPIGDGAFLRISLDEASNTVLQYTLVTTVTRRKAGGLSHHELYLADVKGSVVASEGGG